MKELQIKLFSIYMSSDPLSKLGLTADILNVTAIFIVFLGFRKLYVFRHISREFVKSVGG